MSKPRRINGHVVLLLAAVALPLFWYGYVLADQLIYHGIKPHNGWTEVNLQALGCFPFQENLDGIEQVPARFRVLDGKRIVTTGIMNCPDASSDHVDHFQLVYNLQICCFSAAPKVQERIFARSAPGKTVLFTDAPVKVTGMLHVKIDRDPETGNVISVFKMDVESVDPL